MQVKAKNLQHMMTGQGMLVSFIADDPQAVEDLFQGGVDDEMIVEIRKERRKRSLDANAYFWTLADQLAAKLGTTAVNIYKELVHRVGVFDWVLITEDAVDDFLITWAMKGTGWLAEKVKRTKTAKGRPAWVIKAYKGSSVYSVEEMSRLIEELVMECKEAGIETMTPAEIEELVNRWEVV